MRLAVRQSKSILGISVILLLSACSPVNNFSDLEAFVSEVNPPKRAS